MTVFSFVLTDYLYKSLNGIGCSAFKLLSHFQDGVPEKEYKDITRWIGLDILNKMMDISKNEFDEIKTDITNTNLNTITTSCNDFNGYYQYKEPCNLLKEIKEKYFSIDDNSNLLEYLDGSTKISEETNKMSDFFEKQKTKSLEKIYDILHDYINKLVRQILYPISGFFLIISIINMLLLYIYINKKNHTMRIIYHIISNFEMLIAIIFGLFGVFLMGVAIFGFDLKSVFHFIISSRNIESKNPILFSDNNLPDLLEQNKYINKCINGDGNLLVDFELINEGDTNKNYIKMSKFYSHFEQVNKQVDNLYKLVFNFEKLSIEADASQRKEFTENLFQIFINIQNLENKIDKIYGKTLKGDHRYDLPDIFNCRFMKNDAIIFGYQLEYTFGVLCLFFSIIIMILIIFVTLQMLFSLIVFYRYRKEVMGIDESFVGGNSLDYRSISNNKNINKQNIMKKDLNLQIKNSWTKKL